MSLRRFLACLSLSALAVGCAAPVDREPVETETPDESIDLDDEVAPVEPELMDPTLFEQPTAFETDPGTLRDGLRFVIDAGRPSIVLSQIETEESESAATGPIVRLDGPERGHFGVTRTYRAMNPWHAQAFSTEYLGRVAKLYGASGVVCRVRVDEIGFVHRVILEGEEPDEGQPKPSAAEELEGDWEAGRESGLVIARTVPIEGDCEGARWTLFASERELEPNVVAPDLELSADDERDGLAAFRALPHFQDIQLKFEASRTLDLPPNQGEWTAENGINVSTWKDARHGRSFVLASARIGSGCGEFSSALWALFERDPQTSALVEKVVSEHDEVPEYILDVDGDDHFEVFSGDAAFAWDEDAQPTRASIEVPYHGCPC